MIQSQIFRILSPWISSSTSKQCVRSNNQNSALSSRHRHITSQSQEWKKSLRQWRSMSFLQLNAKSFTDTKKRWIKINVLLSSTQLSIRSLTTRIREISIIKSTTTWARGSRKPTTSLCTLCRTRMTTSDGERLTRSTSLDLMSLIMRELLSSTSSIHWLMSWRETPDEHSLTSKWNTSICGTSCLPRRIRIVSRLSSTMVSLR